MRYKVIVNSYNVRQKYNLKMSDILSNGVHQI